MKKILFVLNHLDKGGIEEMLVTILKNIVPYYSIQVLTLYKVRSPYIEKVSSLVNLQTLDRYRYYIRNKYLLALYSRLFDLKIVQQFLYNKYLKKFHPDIQIAFSDGRAVEIVAGNNSLINKKAWVHTDFLQNDNQCLDHYIDLYNAFNDVVFVSKTLEMKFKKYLGLKSTYFIPNAIDSNIVIEKAKKENICKDNKIINFVAIGRLSKEKGFDRLIYSLHKLTDKQKTMCHLTIIGDGIEKDYLYGLVQRYQLKHIVSLIGFQTNPYAMLKNADALLVPSRFEGFGLVLLEAMALNIPIVATATLGPSEILDNGKYGLLVDNVDNAFDIIISEILRNPSILDKYKFVPERIQFYSIERLKNNILALL